MLTDAQVWGLYGGWVLPAESYDWWIDPNGNDLGRVRELAEDLGAPIGPPEDRIGDPEDTSLPDEFDLADLLHEAFLAPMFGHSYFNWAFELREGRYRLVELAPLHPSTISEIRSDRRGRLEWLRQNTGAGGFGAPATILHHVPRLTQAELIPFVYWPNADRRWIGRSLGRPMFRNWLCKDVLIRVDVTNHERAGGVPWIRTDEKYQGVDLTDLKTLAAEFRVDEEGGAALPPGAYLELAMVKGSDVIGSIRYHDEQMGVVWHSMVRNLAQTPNGSRALGSTFQDLETLARRSMAEWVRREFNRWVMARIWMWNYGERQPPVLRFTPPPLEGESAANRTTPDDPGLAGGAPDPPSAATARVPSPRPVVIAGARRDPQPARAAGVPTPDELASALTGRATVPDRELRREPYAHEVAAAVDFAALDRMYETAADDLDRLFRDEWLPAMLEDITEQIERTRSGSERQRIRAVDMARLQAPTVGVDALTELLAGVAGEGAGEARAELGEQGASVDLPGDLQRIVADHAQAVARMIADGVSIAASRRAVQLSGAGVTPAELAQDVRAYVEGLEHRWERDQISGAVQQAVNAGRLTVFDGVDAVGASFYASELLDAATCSECRAVDGTEYATLLEAQRDYPTGGFRDCRGGPRCRGTVVMVLPDEV